MHKVIVESVNGLDFGGDIGHLAKGEHEIKLTAKQAAEFEGAGIKIEKITATTPVDAAATKPADNAATKPADK